MFYKILEIGILKILLEKIKDPLLSIILLIL